MAETVDPEMPATMPSPTTEGVLGVQAAADEARDRSGQATPSRGGLAVDRFQLIALAQGAGGESPEQVVKRAAAYKKWIEGND